MKRFLQAIADILEAQSGPMTAELSAALRASDGQTAATPLEPPLTGKMLDQILADQVPDPHPLLAEVARVRESLVWYRPDSARIHEAIGSRLSAVELLGPDGMIFNSSCRLGLFLQMPDLFYPAHAHAADELYVVLSGTAEWQCNDSEPKLRPPGSFIHHPSRHWHAMNTRSEPLLVIWGWTGDIGFESYLIKP